jgi:hypothetical protein
MSGYFNPAEQAVRPGLYLRFLELANLQLKKDGTGVVGLPLVTYTGTAVANEIYHVEKIEDAVALFGVDNVKSIEFALENAAKVIVYTVEPNIDAPSEEAAYDKVRFAFDTEFINVFAYDGAVSAVEQDRAIQWLEVCKLEGREFTIVFAATDALEDADPTVGNARSLRLTHTDSVNLINGLKIDGVEYASFDIAPLIAGYVASTPMNKSITFVKLNAEDVSKRLTYGQTKTALLAGSLVLTQTGTSVRIEQGITTNGQKLRKAVIRQGVMRDIKEAINEEIIGQYSNDKDTHSFVISMVKRYLEGLQAEGVLYGIAVNMSVEFPSVGDSMYIDSLQNKITGKRSSRSLFNYNIFFFYLEIRRNS